MNSLTPEERANGSENYYSAMTAYNKSFSRRQFLAGATAAGVAASAGA